MCNRLVERDEAIRYRPRGAGKVRWFHKGCWAMQKIQGVLF
jgi:hypothetical protein